MRQKTFQTPPSVVQNEAVKFSVGSTSTTQGGISRLFLSSMHPSWCEDKLGIQPVFKKLIELRELLAKEVPLQTKSTADTFQWNSDSTLPEWWWIYERPYRYHSSKTSRPLTDDYIQLVLLLSEKELISEWGLIIQDGEIIDIEKDTQSGDVLIYDSSAIHGVMDIDPHLP